MSLIVGDNLGLHSIFGFAESFSGNYPCRFCKAHRDLVQSDTILRPELERTKMNYDDDILFGDCSSTGIKSPCIFNSLLSFHKVENKACDLMHDLLLGVCHYDMALLIDGLIKKGIHYLQ